jgi:hypothetical protein
MTSLKDLLNGYSTQSVTSKNEISQQSSLKKPTNHNTSHIQIPVTHTQRMKTLPNELPPKLNTPIQQHRKHHESEHTGKDYDS